MSSPLEHLSDTELLSNTRSRALRAYVAELEKLRYAVTSRPRTRAGAERSERDAASHSASEQPANDDQSEKRQDPRRRGRRLELHHLEAFAKGGEHSERNLVLRCRAHNSLAAEADFGQDFMGRARDAVAHEPFAGQARAG